MLWIYSQEYNKDSEDERVPARFLLGLGHHGVLDNIKDSEPHDKNKLSRERRERGPFDLHKVTFAKVVDSHANGARAGVTA